MINEVHLAYQELLKNDHLIVRLPELEPVGVVVTAKQVQSDALPAIVNGHAECPGWIRLQSALYRTPAHAAAAPEDGLPLMAEWRLSSSESAHLRQDGEGGWVLYRYRDLPNLADAENACPPGGKARRCLRQWTTVLAGDIPADAAGSNKLAYYVYWGADGNRVRRLFTRFDGFRIRH